MTQRTPTPSATPTPDELVARYLAAQAALDADANSAAQPSPTVHANVLAYAQQLADARTADADADKPADINATNFVAAPTVNTWTIDSFGKKNQASNDHQWKIKALASVAIFGLSSLLFFQWQSASPDEQDAAFSTQRPAPATAPATAPTAATAESAPAPPTAPSTAPSTAPAVAAAVKPAIAPANASTAPAAAKTNDAAAKGKATPAAADAAATATATAPASARESAAQSSGQDKESSKTSALAIPPPPDRAEKSSNAKLRRESAAETAAAPQMEVAPAAPSMAAPAPAAAPAPTPAPSAAPALARGRMAAPDAKTAQNAESSAQRSQPGGNLAARDFATNPAGAAASATASAIDNLAAGAAPPKPQLAPSPTTPLVAAAAVNSALFSAIRSKNRNALQTALGNGADKNAKDNGTPAITLCVQAGQTELVRALAAAGADVNALDAQGISALDHARGRDLQDIMTLLVQYGAK